MSDYKAFIYRGSDPTYPWRVLVYYKDYKIDEWVCMTRWGAKRWAKWTAKQHARPEKVKTKKTEEFWMEIKT